MSKVTVHTRSMLLAKPTNLKIQLVGRLPTLLPLITCHNDKHTSFNIPVKIDIRDVSYLQLVNKTKGKSS